MKNYIVPLLLFLGTFGSLKAQLWEQVGSDLGTISHLFVDTTTNTLYASGVFYSANGETLRGLNVWNGTNWVMEAPVEGTFFANDIVSYNGEIIVGGNIPGMGHLAKWDGENWGPVGTIVEDIQPIYSIEDLHVFGGDLIIGGMIFPFPNTDAVGLVRFDGSDWHDMDTDSIHSWVPPAVIQMCDYNGELYIAGKFGIKSDQILNYNIAKWDGELWHPVGHGLGLTPSQIPVRAFAEYQGELYIGGNFGPEMSYFTKSQYIVKWNGNKYSALSKEEPCCIHDMIEFNNELYVLGSFGQNTELGETDFAKWDGSRWCSLGTVFNGAAYDLEIYNGELYAAGNFIEINGEPHRGVVKWIGGDYVGQCSTPVSSVPEKENIERMELTVFPIPANSFLTVTFPSIQSPATMVVQNLLGQAIYQNTIKAAHDRIQMEIDASTWPVGLYILTLTVGGKVLSKKIWVE